MMGKNTEMQLRKSSIEINSLIKNDSGDLTVTLPKPVEHEQKEAMDAFLSALKTEFRIEEHIKDSFTFTYDAKSAAFTIRPVNVTMEKIIARFDANNIHPALHDALSPRR